VLELAVADQVDCVQALVCGIFSSSDKERAVLLAISTHVKIVTTVYHLLQFPTDMLEFQVANANYSEFAIESYDNLF